jgi:gamma-tubulin complex component 5
VERRLNGLVEKFQVLGKDDRADSLASRLNDLSTIRNKWTPDILFLLLELSDQPAKRVVWDEVEPHAPSPTPAQLTWEEILAQDPLSDEDLWRDVSYSTASSDDELLPQTPQASSQKTGTGTGAAKGETSSEAKPYVIQPRRDILDEIREVQAWRQSPETSSQTHSTEKETVTELVAVRESLLMLRGLPTSIFKKDKSRKLISFDGKYSLANVTSKVFSAVMGDVAEIGTRITQLRDWAQAQTGVPLVEAFQAVVQGRLTRYDRQLAQLDRQYTSPSEGMTVSILEVLDKVRMESRTLVHLTALVTKADIQKSLYKHLQLLHDDICELQAANDDVSFEFMARLFFESLQFYLRPIRDWMRLGQLSKGDTFFVIERPDVDSEDTGVWLEKYGLRIDPDGELLAPRFMQESGKAILNAGKTVVFLNRLGGKITLDPVPETSLDYDTVCGSAIDMQLLPFGPRFETALATWIETNSGPTASLLRDHLLQNCGLARSLDALDSIYLSSDGTLLQNLAHPIFARMDAKQRSWNDRYLVSELARQIFSDHDSVDTRRLSARTVPVKAQSRSTKALSSIAIDYEVR